VELRESAGMLDPYVRVGHTNYSLFPDEGHGLREIVILLTAAYRKDWQVLIVDEPELHLHPSIGRLWLSELDAECKSTARHAVIVTHQPALLQPNSAGDLDAIWHFRVGQAAAHVGQQILPAQTDRVTESLRQNRELVSQLMFSPRPLLRRAARRCRTNDSPGAYPI